jgi:hypothetical protein
MNYCKDIEDTTWYACDLTDFSMGSWEPAYDTELWKKEKILSIFVQNVEQGDSETLESLPPQAVYILDIENIPKPTYSFSVSDYD